MRAGLALACALTGACSSTPVPVTDRSSGAEKVVITSATGSTRPAPVQPAAAAINPGSSGYVVRSGDTLFSIAWAAGVDYRELAEWNGIDEPYVIKPGQRLVLGPPAKSAPATASRAPKPSRAARPEAAANTKATAKTQASPAPRPSAVPSAGGPKGWIWPVEGPILSHFSARSGNKGIDIGGTAGRGIRAAAAGRVVYAGSGLRGYGQLIIVKHDEVYLSAYAHNSKLLVKDGTEVTKGQQIALMGNTGTDRVKLHFEIRQRGQPVNPLNYLPKRP